MDVKSLPWVPELLTDIGLEEQGAGFWSSPDGRRCVYLGDASVVVISEIEGDPNDFQTQYMYPPRVTKDWLFDVLWDHTESLQDKVRYDEERMRWN